MHLLSWKSLIGTIILEIVRTKTIPFIVSCYSYILQGCGQYPMEKPYSEKILAWLYSSKNGNGAIEV